MEQVILRAQAIFIGHGAPFYAVQPNVFTPTWKSYIKDVPKPKAILMISAHWEGHGLAVTGNKMPPTIHDFGNFGEELFSI